MKNRRKAQREEFISARRVSCGLSNVPDRGDVRNEAKGPEYASNLFP
jgi:hypothetical protein